VDLSFCRGREITLRLRTAPGKTPNFDWALWVDPLVMTVNAKKPETLFSLTEMLKGKIEKNRWRKELWRFFLIRLGRTAL